MGKERKVSTGINKTELGYKGSYGVKNRKE